MNIQTICRAVRFCFDEELQTAASLGSNVTYDTNVLMDNIIKAKIGDALRWICLYAPAGLLTGGSMSVQGADIIKDTAGNISNTGLLTPDNGFIRLIRLRCAGWRRAIKGEDLLRENTDDYLQLTDGNVATATLDRPMAVLVEKAKTSIEVWPKKATTYEMTAAYMPEISDSSLLPDDYDIQVPSMVHSSFIYYIAFLTLSAYDDSRAARMLEIAKMHLATKAQ